VIELMGHKAGWLTLSAGLAGGADIILIPEIPYDLDSICQHLTERRRRGKWFSIVAVAEGAISKRAAHAAAVAAETAAVAAREGKEVKNSKKEKKKEKKRRAEDEGKRSAAGTTAALASNGAALDDAGDGRASAVVARAITRRLGIETRVTVLGHLQRGGIPTPYDRIIATRFGTHAAELLADGKYNRMVCLRGSEVTSVSIEKVAGKLKLVAPDDPLIRAARRVGTNFGD
jgi:6-phosphofructokinase 1